jgi:hypothetical protein
LIALIETAEGIGDGIVVEIAEEIVVETENETLTEEITGITGITETSENPTAEEKIIDSTSVVSAEGETAAQTSDKIVAETSLPNHQGNSHLHRSKPRLSSALSHVPSCPRNLPRPIPSIIASQAMNLSLARARTERSSKESTCILNARLH